tara:strand:+ start:2171 stop:3439 length:1269 start_codon:yes stop_codon:yes gene_type:complete
MNKNPLITIYTINRNYSKYLDKCINSVINQTYKKIEYIIIDDGSTDNSISILNKYKKFNNIKVYFQKKSGLIKSINKAIKVSSGEYIVRLDSDDFLHKDAIKILLKKLFELKASVIFPDYYTVDEKDNILNRIKRHNFQKNVTLLNQPAHGACTLYKRSVFEEVGAYSKKYDCQDGVYMWFKVINKYKIGNVNKPLFYYRQHRNSLTRKTSKIIKTKQLIFREFNKKKVNNICFFPIRKLSEINQNTQKSKKIFKNKLKELNKISQINKILISSPDKNIKKIVLNLNSKKISFFERKNYFSNYGTRLSELLYDFIKNHKKRFMNCDNIILYTWNELKISYISHMIDNLEIFKLNCVIIVKTLRNLLFKHDGSGLKPVVKYNSGLQIERDIIYSQINGIVAIKFKSFLKTKNIYHEKIGHVIL